MRFVTKIQKPLGSQNTGKENKKFSKATDWLQICINTVKIFKHALEDNISRSYRVQVAENQTEVIFIRLAELQQKVKSLHQRLLVMIVKALSNEVWDPIKHNGNV